MVACAEGSLEARHASDLVDVDQEGDPGQAVGLDQMDADRVEALEGAPAQAQVAEALDLVLEIYHLQLEKIYTRFAGLPWHEHL